MLDRRSIRCAIYTRKSSEEGLEQDFNSLHAQREACEAYVLSQRHEGWTALPTLYDDGGFSGGSMVRPAMQRLLSDIRERRIDCVVVYKVDRLTRSLADFAKMVEIFDERQVSFVSVTQAFNTTNSMGRLTLNVLLSFAQFEREVTGERIRDKIAASKKKGMWMGGWVPIGYDVKDRSLTINAAEAEIVRTIVALYQRLGNVRLVEEELHRRGIVTKRYVAASGRITGGTFFSRGHIYKILSNPLYRGEIAHKGVRHSGQHQGIIDRDTWERVQEQLKGNGHARRVGRNSKAPSLLAGLLFDDRGHKLLAVHANKDGRRYRYYAARSARQGARTSAATNEPPAFRIAAAEIEPLILERLCALLRDQQQIADQMKESISAEEIRRGLLGAEHLATVLETGTPLAQREALVAMVRQIRVERHAVSVALKREMLLAAEAEQYAPSSSPPYEITNNEGHDAIGDIILRIPVTLARRGVETKLQLEPSGSLQPDPPDRTLVKTVARAQLWWEELSTGRSPSIQAIAEQEGCTDRYVSKVLEFAFLSPRIVEAVLAGSHMSPLTTKDMMHREGIPLMWSEQQ